MKSGDHVQRRGLAAAARAEQRDELALCHGEIDRIHRGQRAEAFGQRGKLQRRLSHCRFPDRGNRRCRRSGRTARPAPAGSASTRWRPRPASGAKPNSRKPRIATVSGRSPGRAMNSDRFTSSKLCTKAKIMPANTPGAASGSVTWRSTANGVAPRLDAAGSTLPGIAARLIAMVRTRERQADHHVADQQRPEAHPASQADQRQELQQRDAGDQAGQDQRAQRDRAHQCLAGELVALEGEGQRHAGGGGDQCGQRREFQAEQQRLRAIAARTPRSHHCNEKPRGGKYERLS